jgi:N-acetylmuramoyl-L-alanine amidase
MNRAWSILLVGWVWLLLAHSGKAAESWEEVRWKGRSYVTLGSFAQFYQMSKPKPSGEWMEMTGEGRQVRVRLDSREAFINGRKTWLSFACVVDEQGRALVSRADVIFLFDPVLRRGQGVPRRPVKGVVIDPGHGGQDRGAETRSGYAEKTATLDTALRLEKLLQARGIPVVMTRRSDVFIPLEQRAALASKHNGHIFVSIHYNAGPSQTHGVETYSLSPQGTPSTSAAGRLSPSDLESLPGNRNNLHNVLLTDLIHREMAKMHSLAGDRGTKRARFVVLREVTIPGVLVEGGFMTNRVDAALIQSGEYRQKVAAAIARGIEAYIREVDPENPWGAAAESSSAPAAPPPAPPAAPAPAPPTAPRPPAVPLRKPEENVAPPAGDAPAPPTSPAPPARAEPGPTEAPAETPAPAPSPSAAPAKDQAKETPPPQENPENPAPAVPAPSS